MSDDGIELDTDEHAEPKSGNQKDWLGILMAVMTVVTFCCLAAALTLQFLEYRYMRGEDKPDDPYASEVLLPPQS